MNSRERHFLRVMRRLGSAEQEQVLTFAEFLNSRRQPAPEPTLQKPNILPAKEGETVVGAIKRLRESYAMLDAKEMLNDTSGLMSRHVMGGEAAGTVIVELEMMFERHYQRYRGAPEDA
ncbi:hypothetical protein [Acidithiobacillus sp.]|jgi:hypothetical protein|uniref:hypothetical protein n=1 Tax=Acidithiobacillus sp. TaxID=1872118 RepID=UPI0025BFD083|nr:hypothetical protein [Acidithiobacillus sp.]MCK9189542.1 hypothetical protein [Acidithiobacillus sp.]MCK9359135.1 hypothetical protein [Acidithiobacillus sp.]